MLGSMWWARQNRSLSSRCSHLFSLCYNAKPQITHYQLQVPYGPHWFLRPLICNYQMYTWWEIPRRNLQDFRVLVNYHKWKSVCTDIPTWEPRYSLVDSRRLTSRDVSKKYRRRTKKTMPRGTRGMAIQGITATATPTTPTTCRNVWKRKYRYNGLFIQHSPKK